jgi:hypothetical protein
MLMLTQAPVERIGPAYLGIVIPLVVFLLAFCAVVLLYRYFTK